LATGSTHAGQQTWSTCGPAARTWPCQKRTPGEFRFAMYVVNGTKPFRLTRHNLPVPRRKGNEYKLYTKLRLSSRSPQKIHGFSPPATRISRPSRSFKTSRQMAATLRNRRDPVQPLKIYLRPQRRLCRFQKSGLDFNVRKLQCYNIFFCCPTTRTVRGDLLPSPNVRSDRVTTVPKKMTD
jgi:hypothetical protein